MSVKHLTLGCKITAPTEKLAGSLQDVLNHLPMTEVVANLKSFQHSVCPERHVKESVSDFAAHKNVKHVKNVIYLITNPCFVIYFSSSEHAPPDCSWRVNQERECWGEDRSTLLSLLTVSNYLLSHSHVSFSCLILMSHSHVSFSCLIHMSHSHVSFSCLILITTKLHKWVPSPHF